jgi:hypothetical protein
MALTNDDRRWFEEQLSKLHSRATENATNIAAIRARLDNGAFVRVRDCGDRHSRLMRTVGVIVGIGLALSVVAPIIIGVLSRD